MEDRMALHRSRKVQLISMAGYFLYYLKPFKSFEVELGGGPSSLDVSAQEPDLIPYLI